MQALILAAGMGKRLGKYTKECTKCMVQVGDKMLIDRTIESLKAANINKLVVVVGYAGEKLEAHLQQYMDTMDITIVYNHDYSKTNNIYSLYKAQEELIKDDTILIESDLIYDTDLIKGLVEAPYDNMVAVAKYEQWMDGTVVLLDSDKNILDFVGKTDFRFDEVEQYYKTVNIYKFSKNFLQNQYLPFLEAYIKAYGKNQYYEQVLKILSLVRFSELKAFTVENYNWYEIDDEQDLKIASTIFAGDDKQFEAYSGQYGGFWRFPKLKDFCYLVNPYYPPKKMVDHMKYFYDTLITEYPSGIATQNLNAARMLGVNTDYVMTGNGAAELIHILGQNMTGTMLIQTPVFNEYVRCFPKCDIVRINSSEYDYKTGKEEICERIDGADIVALINPDNPSGNFIQYDDMIEIIEKCKAGNKLCIIDESFVDFAEESVRYTLIKDELLEQYRNLVVVKSISKSYGVPGLRLGVLATSNSELLSDIKTNMPVWNINSFAEYFLQIHALYEKDYISACNQIAEQRSIMEKKLSANALLKVYPSQANYIMCRLNGRMTARELANTLAKKYNILIKDLTNKDGIEGQPYIRVAVKNEEENACLVDAINKELR